MQRPFYRITLNYGLSQHSNIPGALAKLDLEGLKLDPQDTTFFLGRENLLVAKGSMWSIWHKSLFAFLSRNSQHATKFFRISPNHNRDKLERIVHQQAEKLGLKELIAMGVVGMVGGGIFSVLGLSVALSGHAAPIAFALGGLIALLTGLSYSKLGVTYRSDGGSFTYLEHAFQNKNISGIGGWLLLTGYMGTLALYAYTFGVYGAAMFGQGIHGRAMQHLLESLVLLLFLGINLYGIKAAGKSEDVIVMVKVLILSLFAVVGIFYVKPDHLLPVFNLGKTGVLMGAALIFVAYEGFELIPNAVNEMENPERNLRKAIVISVLVTTGIYIFVSLVAVGNLLPSEISKYKEYALYLYKTNWKALEWIGVLYMCVIIAELCFSERRLFFRQGA